VKVEIYGKNQRGSRSYGWENDAEITEVEERNVVLIIGEKFKLHIYN